MYPALIASLAAAGLLADWPQRAVIARLDISPRPPALAVGAVTAVLLGGLAARVQPGQPALVLAAACGYALTATLLKSAVAALDTSVAAFFSSWELYGTAVAGVGALFLLQNALQAGSLVAVQPPLTLGDAIISACYGVTVFGEDVNIGGGLLVIEIVAVLAIAIGCVELSRSLAMVHQVQPAELPCAAPLASSRM